MTVEALTAKKTDVAIVYDADTKQFPYHAHEKVARLLEEAKKAFGVVSNHVLSLFTSAGTELEDEQTLAEAKVQPGEELVLGQSIIKGG